VESEEHSVLLPGHAVVASVVSLGHCGCRAATMCLRLIVVAQADLPDGSLARVEELAWFS